MSSDRRILHITPIPVQPLIGPFLRCLRQGQAARQAGYEVFVLSRKRPSGITPSDDHGLQHDPLFEGITLFERLPHLKKVWLREIVNLLWSWYVILKTLGEVRPALVHVHNPPETIPFIASIVCRIRRIPVIYDVHDGVYELISSLEIHPLLKRLYLAVGLFFERNTLGRSSGILTVCEALKQAQVARAGRYIGSTPYVVMRNVNPAWMMSGDDAPQQEGNFILHSGTLFTATLGLEDLVDILPGIYAKTGCRLVLAGDGPYRPVLQRYVEEKKAGHMVDFLGHIGREQLYQLTREARLCVMPFRKTRQLSVAVPNKLFEYMALQKAFVYPDLPGFREILGDDNAGKYVPGDSSDMEKKILSLLTDDALRQGLGLHHKALLQHFTFEKESARLLNLYQSLLSR